MSKYTTGATNWQGIGNPSRASVFRGIFVDQYSVYFFVDHRLSFRQFSIDHCIVCIFFLFKTAYWNFNIFKFSLSHFNWALPVELTFVWCNWPLTASSGLYLLDLTFTWYNWPFIIHDLWSPGLYRCIWFMRIKMII